MKEEDEESTEEEKGEVEEEREDEEGGEGDRNEKRHNINKGEKRIQSFIISEWQRNVDDERGITLNTHSQQQMNTLTQRYLYQVRKGQKGEQVL